LTRCVYSSIFFPHSLPPSIFGTPDKRHLKELVRRDLKGLDGKDLKGLDERVWMGVIFVYLMIEMKERTEEHAAPLKFPHVTNLRDGDFENHEDFMGKPDNY
jgi:hypothetical protein